MEENEIMNDGLDPVASAMSEAESTEPTGDASSVIKKRLAQQRNAHQKELDRRDAENAQLRTQLEQMQSHVKSAENAPQMIPMDAIPILQQQFEESKMKQDRVNKVVQRFTEAAEKDPELKELGTKNGHRLKPEDLALMGKFESLPNIPAVIKKILKDPTEYEIYSSAPSDYEKARYIKELSEKLDNRSYDKGSNRYEPAEQLSGSSPATSDLSEYVKKYRGR